MAEEKSAGSGFGRLVYGTLKGNGINTDDLSFDEAVKKFNELGGTDNWHAKILRKEAEENKEKEERNKESTTPKVEDYTEQLQKLSKEQNVEMKYIQEDLQTRLDEGQNPEEALKEIESNLKNAKPESLKEKVDRRIKSFMDKAKKGKIKAEGNAPKEFKWNDKTNSYEYGGANVMKSFVGKDLYEVDVQGEELIVSSLDEAKKKIDQMNAYAKKHNGYMYGEDKYI